MAIQYGEGPVQVDADDAQFTHRGKTIAIKIRVIMWPVVLGLLKLPDGSWSAERDLTGDMFGSDPPGGGDAVEYAVHRLYSSADAFVRGVCMPILNDWLAELWAPTDPGDEEPPPIGDALRELQAALARLRFVVRADGTVLAAQ